MQSSRRISLSPASRSCVLLLSLAIAGPAWTLPAQEQFLEEELPRPSGSDTTMDMAVADVDGDGDMDIATSNTRDRDSYQNRLLLNNGDGTYEDVTETHMPTDSDHSQSIAFADVDGDGDQDMVIGNSGASPSKPGARNRLYLNDGKGKFTDVTETHMPADSDHTQDIAVGDVDGDGDVDLVIANSGTQNQVYLNDGKGKFKDGTTAPLNIRRMPVDRDYTQAVALGDVDHDGDLDLVVGNYFVENRLYLNDGSGSFRGGNLSRHRENTESLTFGDIDGDGDDDLVVGNGGASQNRLYLNLDSAGLAEVTDWMPKDNDNTYSVAMGDVDGDGDNDMFVANVGDQDRVLLNDGGGSFTDDTDARVPADKNSNTKAAAMADVDGDGDQDVIKGNLMRSSVLRNLHGQIDTPVTPMLGGIFAVDVYSRPGYATCDYTAYPAISLGLAPTPISIHPLGDVYIDPTTAAFLPRIPIPKAWGCGRTVLFVPDNPALHGLSLYTQAVIVDNCHPDRMRLTNYTSDRIGG